MSYQDWLNHRHRQKKRTERAHTLGKYRGKQAEHERHQKVLCYRQVKKLSIRETAEATGYSSSQTCRIQALYKDIRVTDIQSGQALVFPFFHSFNGGWSYYTYCSHHSVGLNIAGSIMNSYAKTTTHKFRVKVLHGITDIA